MRNTLCLYIGKCIIIKLLVLPSLIYALNAILTKIQVSYFIDISKLILKFIWKSTDPKYPTQH